MQPIHLLNVPMSHRFNTIHSPVLSNIFSGKTNKAKSRACNLSLFMSDFARINGFNEEFVGWGEEDSEFAWRLIKSGVDKVNLRFCAVQYHLDHNHHNENANKAFINRNVELFTKVREQGEFWCEYGFEDHLSSPVAEKLVEVLDPTL